MRYEPAMNEPAMDEAAPRAIRSDIALPWPVGAPRMGAGGEARSRRQAAELDIWEDDGGTPVGRASRSPGRQVDSRVGWNVERQRDEPAG
jgi:hypothetical protein